MVKVTFVHPDLGIGGAERLVLDIAITLSNNKYKVNFLTNHFDREHSFKELKAGNFHIDVVGDWLPRNIFGKCYALCAYIRMLYLAVFYLYFSSEDKADIYFVDQIPIAVPFIKWAGGKVIYYCHHPDLLASPPGGFLKKLYRKPIDWLELKGTSLADIILVNSKYTELVFRETFPQIRKDLKILYPTISKTHYETVSKRKTVKPIHELLPELSNVNPNKTVFLSINRFHPAKNLSLAINAFAELKKLVPANVWDNTYLIIAGGYDPQSAINASHFHQLVELVNKVNLNKNVIFLKSPSDLLKSELLMACDCLIYTPEKEHFGIVPLEAMIACKPVIAVDSGGPRESVQHGETGFLSKPDANSMAEFMHKMLNKETAKEMGIKGKMRLEELFSVSVFEESVVKIVEGCLVSK